MFRCDLVSSHLRLLALLLFAMNERRNSMPCSRLCPTLVSNLKSVDTLPKSA